VYEVCVVCCVICVCLRVEFCVVVLFVFKLCVCLCVVCLCCKCGVFVLGVVSVCVVFFVFGACFSSLC